MKTALLLFGLFAFAAGLPALSGFGTSAPVTCDTVDPILELTSPSGVETWYIGDTNAVTWTASDANLPPDGIDLWYSLNGGADYLPLAAGLANTGSYLWELPPAQSYNARVRIKATDAFGNFSQDANSFALTYVPPQTPTGLAVNTGNNVDAVISWDPVTQTIYNTPITPDGYIVLYNETPYEDDQFYYFLGRSYTTAFTHHDVAEFRDQMFYRVVAYKNYRGDVDNILQAALADPTRKLSLAELKAALRGSVMGGVK